MAAIAYCSSRALSPPEASTFKSFQPLQVKHASTRMRSFQLMKHGKNLHCGQIMRRSCNLCVYAEYNGRKGGGTGDFFAGFLLGGVIFGALGYLLAPQVSRTLSGSEGGRGDESSKKLAKSLDDDEGLEKTRRNLNEKIAQLNAAIDDVSAQLRSDDGFGIANDSTPELESAV